MLVMYLIYLKFVIHFKDLKELCKKCGVKYHAREEDPISDEVYIKVIKIVSII